MGLTGPETSLHYPPVPATMANSPKPMTKRNGNTGPSNRKSIIFTRVDFFISRNIADTSGGPVLDSSGNVVGVVSHGLSKKYADATGHIAQNVNFAVKSYLVESLMRYCSDTSAPL